MPKTVTIPGYDKPIDFPDSMSQEQINVASNKLYGAKHKTTPGQPDIRERYKKMYGREMPTVGAAQGPMPTPIWRETGRPYQRIEQAATKLGHKVLEPAAPAVAATVGSLIAPGPGTAIGAAALGGALGAGAQGKNIGESVAEGGKQALYEAGGRGVGAVLGRAARPLAKKIAPEVLEKYPILKNLLSSAKAGEAVSPKAVQHLTAAAATKEQAGEALAPIAKTMDDISQEMLKLPQSQRTVPGFLSAVNARKDAMNAESGVAMAPIGNKETIAKGILDRLEALKNNIPMAGPKKAMNVAAQQELDAINRAEIEFQRPLTYHNLDLERGRARARLDSFMAKDPVPQYTALKSSRTLAIDNAIEQGLKDTVYSEMDRAAGKPAGYFANLKGRQSSLISLQKILDKRVRDLSGQQAVSEVTPRISAENLSLSMHPGTLPRGGLYGLKNVFSPPREMKAAGKHVAKAFPKQRTIDTMPYQVLFAGTARSEETSRQTPKKGVAAALSYQPQQAVPPVTQPQPQVQTLQQQIEQQQQIIDQQQDQIENQNQ